ncbi:MAG: electron transfer flavoprotein subunit beta/FixA family protein [Candidatus Dormibacteraeota bacterium]|jgi:electron transfer flavoprotein beta subunit|nr:electron transfer flavoprotein subunit beta/FixA family protein [Candidatus Dormibacteraeota bacterium]
MKIAVFVKQIPDPSGAGRLDPVTHRLVRDGVEVVLDPGDAYGIEAALQLAESAQADVVAISMGAGRAGEVLRKAMAMGVSSGIHVSDDRLQGADALTTARVLAAAVARCQADMVVAGTESTDGYTGLVPSAVAEFLGWPALTFAKHLELAGDQVRIQRQTPAGHDLVEAQLPAVVTVTGGINEPRYPTLKGIMGAKSKPLESWDLTELGLDPAQVAHDIGLQFIKTVAAAPAREAGRIIEDDGTAAKAIADFLAELKVI